MADDSQFRDHAANERTLLAWIRTGVALMAFGFAIARFGLFLREITPAVGAVPGGEHALGSGWFGVALVLFGLWSMIRLLSVISPGTWGMLLLATFATWLRTTWLPYVQRVPENSREEFIAAVTRRYLAKHPEDAGGNVHVRMVRLEIDARK